MSGPTTVTEFFGDAVHAFKLPLAQLEELQDKTGVGPAALLGRLFDGSWRVRDVTETLRLGLIGGGMGAAEAATLLGRYVDGQPLARSLGAAIMVLSVTLSGRKAETASGEARAAQHAADPTGSTSPPSAAVRSSSASGRPNSKGSRSTSSKPPSTRGTTLTPKTRA